jgi:death-on-curing protein
MIESALARPHNGYYRTIEQKAAALTQSMATNHGFIDGNKRTTVILLDTMLTKSGYKLTAAESDHSLEDAVEDMVLRVVSGDLDFPALVDWFKTRIRKM